MAYLGIGTAGRMLDLADFSLTVQVARTVTPEVLLEGVEGEKYLHPQVLHQMPKGEGDRIEIHLFRVWRDVDDVQLEKEYADRDLKPADAYTFFALSHKQSVLEECVNIVTVWKDSGGQCCFAGLARMAGKNYIAVHQSRNMWNTDSWFAGIRNQ